MKLISLILTLAFVASCGADSAAEAETQVKEAATETTDTMETETVEEVSSIKEAYADYFDIGTCINPTVVGNADYANLVVQNFSSVTCENDMKPEAILQYAASTANLDETNAHMVVDFSSAEAEVDFAEQHGLKMRGHTLVWHSQTPDWIFYDNYDTSGELASRELMLERLDNYMKDVFEWADTKHPGLFYAWDVVNEAIGDDNNMRESLWYQTIGEDYVEQAFAIARKYAPDYIKLFYNDYNSYQPGKHRAIIALLQPIADAGNLDGVGMQGHLGNYERGLDFATKAEDFAEKLGVVIHVTEIDVTQPDNDPEHSQAVYYKELFGALKNARESGVPIESVSVWGLTDDLSWKAEEKPLLFNGDLSPKEAYDKVLEAAE